MTPVGQASYFASLRLTLWVLCHPLLQHAAGFYRTVSVEYVDGDLQGHFTFGRAIGEAMGDVIREAWSADAQLARMEAWVETGEGRRIFSNLVKASNESFPLYTIEVEGMALGARVPLKRLLVNQLREELSQWVDAEQKLKRSGHCTDAYVYDVQNHTAAWGHNDDWGVFWRNSTYFVVATAMHANHTVKMKFGSWVYPGYLVGMQLNWNSHGLAWSVNSLFPHYYKDHGVGTAWVARHMVYSDTVESVIQRASDPRVSTAMNYNIGNIHSKSMWNLEVQTGGIYAVQQILGPYLHVNQFKLLNVSQFPEESSVHREARWAMMRPNTLQKLRSFLSDRKDIDWPVWRNRTRVDDCYTEVTGIFDLERRVLSVWSDLPSAGEPQMEFPLSFHDLIPRQSPKSLADVMIIL